MEHHPEDGSRRFFFNLFQSADIDKWCGGDWSEEKWLRQMLKQTLLVCTSVFDGWHQFFFWISSHTYSMFVLCSYSSYIPCRCWLKNDSIGSSRKQCFWLVSDVEVVTLLPWGLMRVLRPCIFSGIDQSSVHTSVFVYRARHITPPPKHTHTHLHLHLHLCARRLCHSATPL